MLISLLSVQLQRNVLYVFSGTMKIFHLAFFLSIDYMSTLQELTHIKMHCNFSYSKAGFQEHPTSAGPHLSE